MITVTTLGPTDSNMKLDCERKERVQRKKLLPGQKMPKKIDREEVEKESTPHVLGTQEPRASDVGVEQEVAPQHMYRHGASPQKDGRKNADGEFAGRKL